jgi:hypothetical protein
MLHRSAERLRELKTYGVHAEATRDNVVRDGFKVKKALSQDVLVREPNQMRADVSGDDGRRTLVYDGRSLSLLAEPENYYATVPAESTVRATLDAVLRRYAVDFPLADLIYIAAGGDVGKHITEAGVIGPSRVAGVDCDHLAFRTSAVDWQVWLDRSTLLPRKIVVTSRQEASAPEYEAVLTWATSPQITEDRFAFSPPAGAKPMSLLKSDNTVDLAETVRHPPNANQNGEEQKKGTTP